MIATLFLPRLLLFFAGSSVPKAPEPAPPPPEKTSTQIQAEAAAAAAADRRRKGGAASILTGSAAGDLTPAPTGQKTLLGQ